MATEVEKLIAAVEANTGTAAVQLEAMNKLLDRVASNRRGKVKIDVDDRQVKSADKSTKSLNTQLTGLQGTAQKLQGIKLGAKFSELGLAIPTVMSAIGPLVGGINSLGAGAIGLVAPLSTATNLLAGLPGVLIPAAGAFGTFKLATLGVGDAIKESVKLSGELADAMAIGDTDKIDAAKKKINDLTASMEDKFAPAALDFIGMMPLMQVEAQELGKSLQPGLFRGATTGLRGLETMVRNITPQLGMMSAAMGGALGNLGRQVGSADFGSKLNISLSGSAGMVSALTSGLSALLDVAVDLGAKAQPVLGRIEGSLSRLSADLRMWSSEMTSGRMEKGYETFQKLWSVISNTGDALAGTLAAFKPMGDWLWDSLDRLTGKWADWTNSITGQNALKQWAEDSKPVLSELGGFIADFAKMWARLSNESGMTDIIKSLREGFLPSLEKALSVANDSNLFGKLIDSLGGLVDIFATLAGPSSVLGTMVDGLSTLVDVGAGLLDTFPLLANVVGNLATAFGLMKLIGIGSPIGMGLTALVVISESLFGTMKPLVPIIAAFGAAWATVKIAGIATQIGAVVSAMTPLKAGVAGPVLGIGDAAKGATGGVGALGGAVAGLSGPMIAATAGLAVLTTGVMMYSQAQADAKNRTQEVAAVWSNLDPKDPFKGVKEDLNQRFIDKGMIDDLRNAGTTVDEFTEKGASGMLKLNEETGRLETTLNTGTWDGSWWDGWLNTTGNMREQVGGLDKSTQDYITTLSKEGAGFAPTIRGLNEMAGATADGVNQTLDSLIAQGKLTDSQARAILTQSTLADGKISLKRLSENLSVALTGETDAQTKFNDAIETGQKKLDAFYAVQSTIASEKDFVKSQDDLIGKLQETETSLKTNGKTMDQATEAGRANRDSVRSMYDQYLQLAEGVYKSTGNAEQAQNVYKLFTARLEDLKSRGLLPANTSIEDLTNNLQLTARSWNADFNLAIKDEQVMKLEVIKSMATEMNDQGTYRAAVDMLLNGDIAGFDKTYDQMRWIDKNKEMYQSYTLEEIRKLTETGVAPSKMPDGSFYYAGGKLYVVQGGKGTIAPGPVPKSMMPTNQQANGSVMMGKFANGFLPKQAKIQSPRSNLIQWAEPETQGEAFIPLAPSKRGRSIAIWHETGKRLGVMADGGLSNLNAIATYQATLKNQTDNTKMMYPTWFMPPAHPASGVGGTGGGAGGSFQTIVDYINSLGIPFRNMGTWADRNVAGTNRKSLHAFGRAVDLGDPAGLSNSAALLRIYLALRSAPFHLSELIYSGPGGSNPSNPLTAANHHNHVHAAMLHGGITPFANGGIVRRPTLGLVGERGPEAIIPLRSFANGGFTAEDAVGKAGESMSNAWERIVSGLEKTNPTAAIKAIFTRMLNEGMQTYSDGWEQMYSRIEALQQSMADEAKRRTQNKWEWDYERSSPEKQLALAMKAQRGMVEWSDEWVALQRRIEEARAEVKAGGPAVYIAKAVFNKEADIDAMNRSTSWAVKTARL